jgi:general secretion pathway protein C
LKNAASLANLAALALLGAVLAYWTWVWLAPPPAPRAPAAADTGPTSSANALFGRVNEASGAAAASGALRLLGVVAATGGERGYAVLRLDAKKSVAVSQGEDIEPGLRLAEVHADHIVLDRNGARESLAWPEKGGK